LVKVSLVLVSIGFIVSSVLLFRQKTKKEASAQEVVFHAETFLPNGAYHHLGKKLDCSGFVRAVYRKSGMKIPRSSKEQYEFSKPTTLLERGNLIFFSFGGKHIDHVAIYLGDSAIVHSPGAGKAVKIDTLSKPYYQNRIVAFGKIIKE
jgi:cell wall-associated NlpC family hydrolase